MNLDDRVLLGLTVSVCCGVKAAEVVKLNLGHPLQLPAIPKEIRSPSEIGYEVVD